MKSLSVFMKDLGAALKNPKVLIPMFVVLFIPVLYSGLFLKAFWDPYGKMNELPVAVVNQDKGALYEGKQLSAGSDLLNELKKTDGFQWEFVSREKAEAGLKDNTYYMAIVVPEDFSAKATTLLDTEPQPAKIIFEPNEGYNFLAGQIGGSAVKEIKTKVSAKVTEAYTNSVFDKFTEISSGLGEAGDGATKIADGAGKLDEGAVKLEENLLLLTDGTGKLLNGVEPLTKGVTDLNTGAVALESGTNTLADGLQKLSAAHQQLQDGVQQTADGSKQLSDGLQQTEAGTVKLQAGTQSAVDGTAKLQDGTQSVVEGSGKLEAGLTSSVDGSAKLEAGIKASAEGSVKVTEGAKAVAQGLQQLAQSNPQLAASPDMQKLLAASKTVAAGNEQLQQSQQQLVQGATVLHSGQEQLLQGATQLHIGSQQLDAGVSQLHDGAQQLNAGSAQLLEGQQKLAAGATALEAGGSKLAAGMTEFGIKLNEAAAGGTKLADGGKALEAGTSKLLSGVDQLGNGISTVADGSMKLANGAGELKNGMDELKSGSNELATKLGDAAEQTSAVNKSDSMVQMFAQPVEIEEHKVNEVPNYGTGFAPYFLSLGLFVGALICTLVIPMRESEVVGASRFNRFISRTLSFSMMSLLQSLLAAFVLLYGLGLEVQNVPLFLAFTFITSLSFMWVIQAIVTWLDQPGRFVAIVILIFQLTTSAGTFPLELIPNWMKFFNPLLPMTYSVRGFKAVISTGDYSVMWGDAGTLALYGLAFLALTFTYFMTRDLENEAAMKSEQVLTV
ncbi:YhgE/Pip domain-containing protein [Paenibacillus wynnii]|uniref:YhgE/Pip domain-containing protein n=1 Tax=Paenibacillus wynnii TaxID=268407 RepID=UPI00278CD5C3|nr:YhgE/Pip domain-containing protein [Paenibacillus wynnii]MDQ0193999.1 putative membrane protein [Paenibacillus wynnii]